MWEGPEAITRLLHINEGQREGELFSFVPFHQNNTAKLSREVRLCDGFYFNKVKIEDFTSTAFRKLQNVSSKEKLRKR